MINSHSMESFKIVDGLIDPKNAEELKRTKSDIETKITKIQKLIKNDNQSKTATNSRRSKKETELMGLTEDLYKQYQSLYAQYDNVIGKVVSPKKNKASTSNSSDSESEYFSSEEVDGINKRRSEKEKSILSDTVTQEPDRGDDSNEVKDPNENIDNTNEVLKTEASVETTVEATECERQLNSLMEEMRSLSNDKTNLELQNDSQANEVKELSIKNTELQNHVTELESLLKEKQGAVSDLEAKLINSEEQAKSNIVKLMAQVNELILETKSLTILKYEMEEKIKCNKNEASVEREELMEKVNGMQQKLDSLENLNKELETQMEGKCDKNEISVERDELMENLNRMQQKLDSLENLNKELEIQKDELMEKRNSMQQKLDSLENLNKELETQREELMKKRNGMHQKLDSLENLTKELETQREELMEKLNSMQQKLDSQENLNKELETQMEVKGEEILQYLTQMENLKEKLAETKSLERTMMEEKVGFLAVLKEMELELETQSNQKIDVEEQLRDTTYELKHTMNENKALQDRNDELKAAMTQRGEEITNFLLENDSDENGASMEIMALRAQINDMRLELDSMYELKSKLELQNERNQNEYAESLAKMENLNAKLAAQIADQENTIKDHTSTIDRIKEEQKQTVITSNKFNLNLKTAEKKMEELAEKLRKKMEDNIRLLHQRIHVAEQLNNENKNSCKLTNMRYEKENKTLGEKVAIYEDELRRLKEDSREAAPSSPVVDQIKFEFEAALNGLDVATAKLEEHRECIMSSVSKMLSEVQLAKGWIKKMNAEMKQLKDNVDSLTELLSEKEEQELLLRDKVWNLEATVSKEGGERLNLTNAVHQLEKKVVKLEKNLKEKDEDLDSLGEKKREAIRQLCLVVEFHRDRCNYLVNLVSNMRNNKKT
ncbi:COP1-interactive protein 1-like [Vicia villosa]|uniref:COP1-interactive protein 1-like n=1 Tax=Vicia villosa TaxID=3911 RepID=UPI00273C2866|nr:COP1-interactive protein 1-like [Vicia villosa]